MGFWQSVNNTLQSVYGNSVETKPRTMKEVELDTAEQVLTMQSKIAALNALNQADDFDELMKDDREKVRQYEEHKLAWRKPSQGGGKGADDMGHVLGDVTIQESSKKNPVAGLIVPLAAILTGGYLLNKYMDGEKPADQPPAAVVGDDTYKDVNVGFGSPQDFKDQIK